ncbi:MAG: NAD(P)-dependent oxidoreductase [Phycisphaeraceae bacterium]
MSKPRVIVNPHGRSMADLFSDADRQRLHERFDAVWAQDGPMPTEAFLAELPKADAVIFSTWSWGKDALRNAAGPGLKAILETGGGHGHEDLDYDYCFERGIRVGSCAWAFADGVAEMALGLTLAATRGIALSDRQFRDGTETYLQKGNEENYLLFGKTVGFVGCGGLSRPLQRMLEPFGVKVLGYDPFMDASVLRGRGIEPASLEAIFETADVVYVLAVPTPENRGLVSRSLMERLREHAVLCVVSRAYLVDFEAMTELVLAGRFRVATDVFPGEPLASEHPLRQAKHAVLSPHRAGGVPEALQTIGKWAIEDLASIFADREPMRYQYATPAIRQLVRASEAAEAAG